MIDWTLISLICFCRLKRTTDVMFGGKQIIICGYGEVSQRELTLMTVTYTLNNTEFISLVNFIVIML